LRERAHRGRYALHFFQQLIDPGTGFREAPGQGLPRRIEIVRKQEWLVERTAARFVKRVARDPFDGVDDAGAPQRAMFRIAGIVRIAG